MKRWWSSDADLLGQLTPLASRLTATARSLRRFFAHAAARAAQAAAIEGHQRVAKALTHALIARLDGTFVALFDREDLHRIATAVEAVMALVAGTARRVSTFRLTGMPDPVLRLADTLARSTQHLEAAVSLLGRPEAALDHCLEMKRLEQEGDAVYYDGLSKLFEEERQVAEVLKWKDVYDRLEEALDKAARVAHLLNRAFPRP